MCEANALVSSQTDNVEKSCLATSCNYISNNRNIQKEKNNQNSKYVSLILDSGPAEHLTNAPDIFTTLEKLKSRTIKCANRVRKADLTAED